MTYARRGLVSMAALWLGLALCVVVLLRAGRDVSSVRVEVAATDVVVLLTCMVIVALSSLMAWSQIVAGVAGVHMPFFRAYRQMALLLLGKYVPGGVVGFLARLHDGRDQATTSRLAAAGLVEQLLGLATIAGCGLLLYACGALYGLSSLLLLLLLPVGALASMHLGVGALKASPGQKLKVVVSDLAEKRLAYRTLLPASMLILVSNLGWAAIAAMTAVAVAGLEILPAIGFAGAYAIGIAAGMVALVVPGGIGVREAVTVGFASAFVDADIAMTLAALLRVLAVLFDVLVGAIAIGAHFAPSFFRMLRRSP